MIKEPLIQGRRGVLALAALFTTFAARRTAAAALPQTEPEKPFASHHLCLQLSDETPAKQKLVLSVANNMLKEFSPDAIAIEVVTFGPGIALLHADSPLLDRIDSLVAQGIRFSVCMNTVHTTERETGKKLALNPHAVPVDAGVAHMILLSESKYTIVRP